MKLIPVVPSLADSRGTLSWHAQPYDRTLHEEIVIRLEVSDALPGSLAIYGSRFGRYPIDPTVLFVLRTQAP